MGNRRTDDPRLERRTTRNNLHEGSAQRDFLGVG